MIKIQSASKDYVNHLDKSLLTHEFPGKPLLILGSDVESRYLLNAASVFVTKKERVCHSIKKSKYYFKNWVVFKYYIELKVVLFRFFF